MRWFPVAILAHGIFIAICAGFKLTAPVLWFKLEHFSFFFLVGYVEERLWWPIQSPNVGEKKKASS